MSRPQQLMNSDSHHTVSAISNKLMIIPAGRYTMPAPLRLVEAVSETGTTSDGMSPSISHTLSRSLAKRTCRHVQQFRPDGGASLRAPILRYEYRCKIPL